eukprot:2345886-Pyramimonas_sp.AAC.1
MGALEDARLRGRWQSRGSVWRCEKGSRIGQILRRLPDELRAHALLCKRSLSAIVRGRPCQAAPSPRPASSSKGSRAPGGSAKRSRERAC